jgi:Hint domain
MRPFAYFVVPLLFAVVSCSPNAGTGPKTGTTGGPPPPPCHPGCFPAGTAIVTPEGSRPVESIRPGDVITLVGSNGQPIRGKVESIYQTNNILMDVRTDSGSLLTTTTQPLCLETGGLRPAGELVAGDRIWRWEGEQRRSTVVREVVSTGREAAVFNLVVGESAVFIAGGFLARGKPPLVTGEQQ